MYLNVDVRQFQAILQFYLKLPNIHNANQKKLIVKMAIMHWNCSENLDVGHFILVENVPVLIFLNILISWKSQWPEFDGTKTAHLLLTIWAVTNLLDNIQIYNYILGRIA